MGAVGVGVGVGAGLGVIFGTGVGVGVDGDVRIHDGFVVWSSVFVCSSLSTCQHPAYAVFWVIIHLKCELYRRELRNSDGTW